MKFTKLSTAQDEECPKVLFYVKLALSKYFKADSRSGPT